jgi:hypothetical protein
MSTAARPAGADRDGRTSRIPPNVLETLLEVRPGAGRGARVTGWAEWRPAQSRAGDSYSLPLRLTLEAIVDAEADLASLELSANGVRNPTFDELIGAPASTGFRRRLSALPAGDPDSLFLRRLLDDLPIVLRIAGQAQLVDHPQIQSRPVMPLSGRGPGLPVVPGTDQCEGWRAGGTLVQQILDGAGTLTMALGSEVTPGIADWSPQPPPATMATRRRRRIELSSSATGTKVLSYFRDSYSDPDGVERGLHSYQIRAVISTEGVIDTIEATGLILPYPECWAAATSARALTGVSVRSADQTARSMLVGLGTCTHLTDALRTLDDIAVLAR